jgi:hypothetical protein
MSKRVLGDHHDQRTTLPSNPGFAAASDILRRLETGHWAS